MRPRLVLLLLFALLCDAAWSKDKDASKEQSEAGLVLYWHGQENAILKLTFSRFQNMATYGGQMTLISNVVVQNISSKFIPKASFNVALLDKDRVRVGNRNLVIDELNAGESAKVQFQCASTGAPAGSSNFPPQPGRI